MVGSMGAQARVGRVEVSYRVWGGCISRRGRGRGYVGGYGIAARCSLKAVRIAWCCAVLTVAKEVIRDLLRGMWRECRGIWVEVYPVLVEAEAKGCCIRGSLGWPVVSQMRTERSQPQIPAVTPMWRNSNLPYVRANVFLSLFNWIIVVLLDVCCMFALIYERAYKAVDHPATSYIKPSTYRLCCVRS